MRRVQDLVGSRKEDGHRFRPTHRAPRRLARDANTGSRVLRRVSWAVGAPSRRVGRHRRRKEHLPLRVQVTVAVAAAVVGIAGVLAGLLPPRPALNTPSAPSTVALTATAPPEASGSSSDEVRAVALPADDLAGVLAEVQRLAASPAPSREPLVNTRRLSQAASTVADRKQKALNEKAVKRWRSYLATLERAGITPPKAKQLADPTRLPAGMLPVFNQRGNPVAGVASVLVDRKPVTVLPAETITAVTKALELIGQPYPAITGGEGYDCGELIHVAWKAAGYRLPTSPAQQWGTRAAVSTRDLQVGDLVFFAGGPSGIHHVGLYLGGGLMVDATPKRWEVGVRKMPESFSGAVRVTLPAPKKRNPQPKPGTGQRLRCDAPDYSGIRTGPVGQWGGYSAGRIPREAMCPLPWTGDRHRLRCDAAQALAALNKAFRARFGRDLVVTDSYRTWEEQADCYRRKPGICIPPSDYGGHVWGLAVDLAGGVQTFGSPEHKWMRANASRYGWIHPTWAQPGGSNPEPWHWEFGRIS